MVGYRKRKGKARSRKLLKDQLVKKTFVIVGEFMEFKLSLL